MSEPNIIKFQFFFCRRRHRQSIPKVEENHNFKTEKIYILFRYRPKTPAKRDERKKKKKKKYNKNICTKYNLICYPLIV